MPARMSRVFTNLLWRLWYPFLTCALHRLDYYAERIHGDAGCLMQPIRDRMPMTLSLDDYAVRLMEQLWGPAVSVPATCPALPQ